MSLSPFQVQVGPAWEAMLVESLRQMGFPSCLDAGGGWQAGEPGTLVVPGELQGLRDMPPPFSGGVSEKYPIPFRLAQWDLQAASTLP